MAQVSFQKRIEFVNSLPGKTFGMLTVVRVVPRITGERRVECRCDCGNACEVVVSTLTAGNQKSCGCRRKQPHGKMGSLAYSSWRAMLERCTNPKNRSYRIYGGAGVKVCERWLHSFSAFLEDVGERPSRSYTLDRYPVMNGNYEPGNVRWATKIEQGRNMSTTIFVTIDDTRKSLRDWCDATGVSASTASLRIRRGMDPALAVTVPRVQRRTAAGSSWKLVNGKRVYTKPWIAPSPTEVP